MLHNIYSSVDLLIFFGAICVLSLVQFVLFAVLLRSAVASLQKIVSDTVNPLSERFEKYVQDTIDNIFASEDGKPSQFDILVGTASEHFADKIFQKMNMSAIGQIGGQAERKGKKSGSVMDFFTNIIAQRLGGGQLSLGGGDNGNSSNHSGGDYGSMSRHY